MTEQQDIELCSNFSFLTTDTDMTPSSSNTAAEEARSEHSPPETHKWENPWPGYTYIIREPKSKLQVTLVGGLVRMRPHLGDQGGYHWECIYNKGWLGFRNPSSFVHLGYQCVGIVAEVKHHKNNEFFVTRGYPGGGHVLLSKYDHELRLINIEGDQLCLSNDDRYTVWEFIKVS
ncbi:hypothetical protein F4806DRAFT_479793 [Annulohypoxylon nitens]|nr:hypothetical protein F4806DRAFT_479793 [Annulohypoxylon nitens]